MHKWKVSTDRDHGADEKNEVFCLVMLTSRVMVIKIFKMANFLYFLLLTSEDQSLFGQNI